MNRLGLIISCLLLILTSCRVAYQPDSPDLAYLYSKKNLNAAYSCVYHKEDGNTVIFIKINNIYEGLDIMNYRQGFEFEIAYRIYRADNASRIIDSSKLVSNGILIDKDDFMLGSFTINLPDTGQYYLGYRAHVKDRAHIAKDFVFIDKTNNEGRQNFLVTDEFGIPVFTNQLARRELFRVELNRTYSGPLYVLYYHRDFPIALPPFVAKNPKPFDYRPDSVFTLQMLDGTTAMTTLPHEGFYHFLTDTTSKEGLTLFRFYEGFPDVTSAYQMFFPIRYVTTKKEFSEMMLLKNKKFTVEQFWIDQTGGDMDRALSVLQRYYKHVEEANLLFTSYLEGWKTDRGLIYIVFGPPRNVYRDRGIETWMYGDKRTRSQIEFNFIQVNNPFTHKDYRLIRSPKYRERWYFAVENWRR